MRNAYYRVHKEGKKEVINNKYGQQYGDGEMTENRESFSGSIERMVDKIEKNAMIKRKVLMKPEAQKIIKDKFNVSSTGIQKISDWIDSEDNKEELKYFYELLFTVLKPSSELDICKYDVDVLSKRVTSAKKDKHLVKAKEIIEHVLVSILGNQYKARRNQSASRDRLIISFALMTYMKLMLCKKV
jgi:hypothetical protein